MKKFIYWSSVVAAVTLLASVSAFGTKTTFAPLMQVPSAFLNAINNHVHDGQDADGHCSKINLAGAAQVTGQLPQANMDVTGLARLASTNNFTAQGNTFKCGTSLTSNVLNLVFNHNVNPSSSSPDYVASIRGDGSLLIYGYNGTTPHNLLGLDYSTDEIYKGEKSDGNKIWHNANAAHSFASPGYQRLPNGLIIQWGEGTDYNGISGYGETLTFPIAFPTACLWVGAGTRDVNTESPTNMWSVRSFTTTQVVMIFVEWAADTSSSRPTYMAIGY